MQLHFILQKTWPTNQKMFCFYSLLSTYKTLSNNQSIFDIYSLLSTHKTLSIKQNTYYNEFIYISAKYSFSVNYFFAHWTKHTSHVCIKFWIIKYNDQTFLNLQIINSYKHKKRILSTKLKQKLLHILN